MAIASTKITGSIVALALQAHGETKNTFKDMSKSMAPYEAVMNLTERNVINGFSDDTYRPGEVVARGQAAKFISKILKLDTTVVPNLEFKDVPKSHPFYKYIAALNSHDIIKGYGNGNFGVNDKLTWS